MRISDWSSDVCSSDLVDDGLLELGGGEGQAPHPADRAGVDQVLGPELVGELAEVELGHHDPRIAAEHLADRKSVVQGKSVSVRVDLGGRRIITKKKKQKIELARCA